MDRRQFLSLASFAGLTVASLDAFGRPARPGSHFGLTPLSETYRGPLYITVNAGGGWDPTSLCDPKGAASDMDTDAMNWSFRARDVATTASGLRYAPLGTAARPDAFRRFFERHDRDLLVVNGVDVGTRGHEAGARHSWSGSVHAGTPSFTALVAAVHGRDLPMSYLGFGGYGETLGEVDRVRGASSEPRDRVVHPDRPGTDDDVIDFDPAARSALHASRVGPDELRKLQRYLPELDRGDNPLLRQIQVAMAAYRAGITIAVDLELGGFDTHADHDAEHIPRLCQLLEGLDFIVEEAARQGVGDDFVVVAGSEFGRAPGYNDINGKDHWPVTSVMAMGKGIRGGRVVGATSERHAPLTVDPTTLAVREGGVRLQPGHVHHALRRLAGIDATAAPLYPLDAEGAHEMNLFG